MTLLSAISRTSGRVVLGIFAAICSACGGGGEAHDVPVGTQGSEPASQAPGGTSTGNAVSGSGPATAASGAGSTSMPMGGNAPSQSGSSSTSNTPSSGPSGNSGAGAPASSSTGGSASMAESAGDNSGGGSSSTQGGQAAAGESQDGGATQTGDGGSEQGGSQGSGGSDAPAAGTGNSDPVTVSGCGTEVTVNHSPFGCEFAWGANGNQGNRASYLDFITMWVGYEPHNGNPNGCDGCGLAEDLASTNAMAVYYAYFAGYALPDCNQTSGSNLCTDGARWIKDNRASYIQMYANYAQRTYQASPNKGVVWLLEGDFSQYAVDDRQTDPFSMQELGDLAREITCAIKENAPNAVVAINHSAWLADDVTNDFLNAMPLDIIDMIWTTGLGNNNGFIPENTNSNSYNGATATYAYISNLTGKPIWVDTSFGLSQADDSWSGLDAATLNQRIAEGVIAANITEPPGDYESRVQNLRGQLSSVCQ